MLTLLLCITALLLFDLARVSDKDARRRRRVEKLHRTRREW